MRAVSHPRRRADPSTLPWRFDGALVVSTAHPRDGVIARDARKHGDYRQGGPSSPDATATCDLDPLRLRSPVGLRQRVERVVGRRRRTKVTPAHPPVVPVERTGIARQEVHAKVRLRSIGKRAPEPTTADRAAVRKFHDAGTVGPRIHAGIVTTRPTPRPDPNSLSNVAICATFDSENGDQLARRCGCGLTLVGGAQGGDVDLGHRHHRFSRALGMG